jgi:hypothetical protein
LRPGQRAIGSQADQLDASSITHASGDHVAMTVARLERERMISGAEALTAALQRDLIDPSDFCP